MKNLPLWFKQISGISLLIGASFLTFVGWVESSRAAARRTNCQSNLKQIVLAYAEYAKDYDGKYPLVMTKQGKGWADLMSPYLFDIRFLYQCPEGQESDPLETVDYFYNAQAATVFKIAFPEKVILLGDGADNGPYNAHCSDLPSSWKSDNSSPSHRHSNGANYAFADGHIKWLKSDEIDTQKTQGVGASIYSFSPR